MPAPRKDGLALREERAVPYALALEQFLVRDDILGTLLHELMLNSIDLEVYVEVLRRGSRMGQVVYESLLVQTPLSLP